MTFEHAKIISNKAEKVSYRRNPYNRQHHRGAYLPVALGISLIAGKHFTKQTCQKSVLQIKLTEH